MLMNEGTNFNNTFKKRIWSLPSVLNELQRYNYKIDVVLHPTDLETINAIKKYDINIVY